MKVFALRSLRLHLGVAALLAVGLTTLALAQDSPNQSKGIPYDWSHQHMVFSDPGTFEDAVKNGTYEQWQRIVTDPRFQQQQLRRGAKQWQASAVAAGDPDDLVLPPQSKTKKLKKDWSMTMGSGGKVGADQYPAIFSAYTQANCDNATQPDFAVFNTAVAGVTSGTATQTGTFTNTSTPSGTVVITNGNDSITLTATTGTQSTSCTISGSNSTGNFKVGSGTGSTDATNLAALINATNCGSFVGVSATHTGTSTSLTVNATTPGPGGNNITLGGSLTRFSWAAGTLAGGGQPSIMAYDNLYSSCSGTSPLVYFQYDTNGGTASTSVAMYDDGVQMAFIQAVGTVANLAILKSARNTQGSNASLVTLNATNGNLVAASAYRSCIAPCMTEIALSGSPTVTYSAPYYDFGSDSIYVGDDSGALHKFTNVFVSGTPTELTGGGTASGWPQTIATDPLTSAIYDSTSGNVLVNISGINDGAGAKVARIPAAGGSNNLVISAQVGDPAGYGFYDGPLVDGTAGKLYSFLDGDVSGPDNAAVFQFTTTFAAGYAGVEKTLGHGNASSTRRAYDGTFDNIYYSSSNSSNPSGNIYACGRDSSGSSIPTLYQISFTSNTFSTATVTKGPALTTAAADCSPVAEFFNANAGTGTDWIFLGVTANNVTGTPILCPSGTGCVMNFNVTSASGFTTTKATVSTSLEASGTSGLVVDNALTTTGSTGYSNVYFSPLANQACTGNSDISYGYGTGGCSIQATQAAP